LELDPRCVEIAVFALALAAWTYPGANGYRVLPKMNIACCGLSVGAAKEEWTALANGNAALRQALNFLHDFYQDAPVLGSLLDPGESELGNHLKLHHDEYSFSGLLTKVRSDEQQEAGLAAKGLLDATLILLNKYDLVITNVPYLARGKQDKTLQDFCALHYPAAKNDLATVFLDRCLKLCHEGGTASIVLPQNWLFLISYKKFREQLLKNDTWHMVARLGPGAFETISGEVVKAILLSISKGQRDRDLDIFDEDGFANDLSGLDVSEFRTAQEKGYRLIDAELKVVSQARQLKNPDARIVFDNKSIQHYLGDYSTSYKGLDTGDLVRFIFQFWETFPFDKWTYIQDVPLVTSFFDGMDKILYWESGQGILSAGVNSNIRGRSAWTKNGVNMGQMSALPCSLYYGNLYGVNSAAIIPNSLDDLIAIWCYSSSQSYNQEIRKVDQSLKVTTAALVKVPFDLEYWQKEAVENYPHGLPEPYSDDPTQWIFHGHPFGSVVWSEESKQLEIGKKRKDSTVLQIAIARLLGYRWPAELDPELELSEQSRAWVQEATRLNAFADSDGIVCLPSVRGEETAADRIIRLLAAAYGEQWSPAILDELLRSCAHAGKSLESWLRDQFFAQHCKLFQHRPFIWQIWDGLRDGFSVLINYHSFDNRKLQSLIYSYLGDWITREKHELASGVDGASEKLAAANKLKKSLEQILEGEAPYDIFVRWKSLEDQAIGWNPDLNDGVRMNIRPFVQAEVLRHYKKPILNLNWDKDRGKDVPSAPWYHLDKGDRINDRHLSLTEKKEAQNVKT
ncbi:MAG: BREX-1 system adenine-specific DNA-methyltransferase PglX, partial [Candidatus Cloacimonetes bacterium]|nr:BREX-1 system adenine-specific DNA-methyltransferase PglX [Candidatus Cloacimonadota bacterium]MCK9185294.1 BREX-1 system adenine-specific DNA-methyltransferase PglX [Candidatus Cloacimonadota bacterium]